MLEKTDIFGQIQFSSCLNIIFGIGLGFIKTGTGGFSNPRDYQDNKSYVGRDYDYQNYQHEFYEQAPGGHSVYMSQLHPYMQTPYQGPLYQYLQHQQHPNMYHNYIYPNQEHTAHSTQKRY